MPANFESSYNLSEIEDEYNTILTKNKGKISEELANFIIDYNPIGSEVYGVSDTQARVEFSLPADESAYTSAKRSIQSDIDEIDTLKNSLASLTTDSKDAERIQAIIANLENEVGKRRKVIANLDAAYKQAQYISSSQSANEASSSESNSADPTQATPSSYSSPSSSSDLKSWKKQLLKEYKNNKGEGSYVKSSDYNPTVKFDLSSSEDITSHRSTIKTILSKIVINGECIGGDAYGSSADKAKGTVSFNATDLQLSLDAVKADIDKTKELKEAEEARRTTLQNTQCIPLYDEDGKVIGYKPNPADIATQIAFCNMKIEAYEAEIEAKEKVFEELQRLRKSYSKVCGGLVNLYTARTALEKLDENGNLIIDEELNLSLTKAQTKEFLKNLRTELKNELNNPENKSKFYRKNPNTGKYDENYETKLKKKYDNLVSLLKKENREEPKKIYEKFKDNEKKYTLPPENTINYIEFLNENGYYYSLSNSSRVIKFWDGHKKTPSHIYGAIPYDIDENPDIVCMWPGAGGWDSYSSKDFGMKSKALPTMLENCPNTIIVLNKESNSKQGKTFLNDFSKDVVGKYGHVVLIGHSNGIKGIGRTLGDGSKLPEYEKLTICLLDSTPENNDSNKEAFGKICTMSKNDNVDFICTVQGGKTASKFEGLEGKGIYILTNKNHNDHPYYMYDCAAVALGYHDADSLESDATLKSKKLYSFRSVIIADDKGDTKIKTEDLHKELQTFYNGLYEE